MATHSSVLAWRIPGTGEPGAIYGVAQSRIQLKWLSSSSRRIHPWIGREMSGGACQHVRARVGGARERERKKAYAHGRKREWERESACTRERERKRYDSSFYIFLPPPGPTLCKLGLARSAVCSSWGHHSSPWTFLWPSFVLFSQAFPFLVFLPLPFWTPVSYSNYLTIIFEKWKSDHVTSLHKIFSGYSIDIQCGAQLSILFKSYGNLAPT